MEDEELSQKTAGPHIAREYQEWYKTGVMNSPSCNQADIHRQLKVAFRELVMTEEFHLKGNAYYATLGATQASELVSGKHCPPLAKCTNFSTCRWN